MSNSLSSFISSTTSCVGKSSMRMITPSHSERNASGNRRKVSAAIASMSSSESALTARQESGSVSGSVAGSESGSSGFTGSADIGKIEISAKPDKGDRSQRAADPPAPAFDRIGIVRVNRGEISGGPREQPVQQIALAAEPFEF